MTKEVLVKISGLQFATEQEAEPVEVITAGDYYMRNGKHYVVYEEVAEGFEGKTRNVIKLGEKYLDITKKGVSNVHMVFEKNRKNVSYYHTPFGSILIGIDARDVKVEETEDRIDVEVKYALEVNYEFLADCNIKMNIISRENGQFTI